MNAAALSLSPGEAPDHPRRSADLIGHRAAEAELLAAWRSGRLSHAWLIGGPRGIGKATLAFRFARFLLARGDAVSHDVGLPGLPGLDSGAGPEDLALAPTHPVFLRVASGGHADLLTIERQVNEKTGRLRSDIGVEEVRRLGDFFAKTAAEGGWRVAIVDAADEMSRSAANALLKILEEPPARAVILVVAHAPGGLLATIRSRCRRLVCRPLAAEEVATVLSRRAPALTPPERLALSHLADGSPGRALALAEQGGLAAYRDLLALLETLPDLDLAALHAFAERLARAENQALFRLTGELLSHWLVLVVRSAAAPGLGVGDGAAGEQPLIVRLGRRPSLDRWLDVWEKVNHILERAESVNLDRKQVLLNIFFALARAAQA